MDRDKKGKFLEGHINFRKATKKICSVNSCDRKVMAKGLCSKHYQRNKKYGNPIEPYKWIGRPLNREGFICEVCQKSFFRCPSEIKKSTPRFCSRKCSFVGLKGELKRYKPIEESNWILTRKGYLVTYRRRKRILQHRWVLEQHLGRKLLKKEVVHHINGIKTDNRVENLAVCSQWTHHLFIKKLQERIKYLERKLKGKNYER